MTMTSTTRRLFHPFRYAGQQGRVVVTAVDVDGATVTPFVVSEEVVDLRNVDLGEELRLHLHYVLPTAVLDTLPEDERAIDAVRVVIVAEEADTWVRESVRLERQAEGFVGSITLRSADLRHAVVLRCVVARTRGRAILSGVATELAAALCTSPPLLVRLAEPSEAPGSFMSMRWAAFSEQESLRRWAGQPFYLQLTTDPPILWLNNELPDLREVLSSTARTGRAAVFRDVLYRAMATACWTALFTEAARGVARDDTGTPTFARAWHEQALTTLADRAYTDRPRGQRTAQLVDRILEAIAAPEGWALLQEDVARGLGQWLDLGGMFDRAARELTR